VLAALIRAEKTPPTNRTLRPVTWNHEESQPQGTQDQRYWNPSIINATLHAPHRAHSTGKRLPRACHIAESDFSHAVIDSPWSFTKSSRDRARVRTSALSSGVPEPWPHRRTVRVVISRARLESRSMLAGPLKTKRRRRVMERVNSNEHAQGPGRRSLEEDLVLNGENSGFRR
jgi:hypothetical protein